MAEALHGCGHVILTHGEYDLTTVVDLDTSLGRIEIDVDLHRAPLSGSAFLQFIVNGMFAREGAFVRVVRGSENDYARPPINVVQAALLDASASLFRVEHESTVRTRLRHVDGTVSLARGALGTATGAAFFICIGEQPALDAGGGRSSDGEGFAAFGRVSAGMDVVRMIHDLPTSQSAVDVRLQRQMLDPPVRIIAAAVRRSSVRDGVA